MPLKTLLLLLTIWISSNSQTQAQSTTKSIIDTICRPVPEYKLIFKDAQLYRFTDSLLKISEAQLAQLKSDNEILKDRSIEEKAECRRQMDFLESQIVTFKDQIKGYETLLKKERRRRRLTTAAGVLTTAGAIYLFIQK